MTSQDGQEGIKLDAFLKMWAEDGTQLIEQERRDINGAVWVLYAIYFPESTYDYGRHMALLIKVDRATDIILLHDLTNLAGEVEDNYRQGIDDWFNRHVGQY